MEPKTYKIDRICMNLSFQGMTSLGVLGSLGRMDFKQAIFWVPTYSDHSATKVEELYNYI